MTRWRFSLRALLILLLVAPPLIAGFWVLQQYLVFWYVLGVVAFIGLGLTMPYSVNRHKP